MTVKRPKPRRDSNGNAWRKARARVIASEDSCGICGRAVDKSLHHSDPLSATVDHIIPFALGGSALERSNLQLAHRTCNQTKGDRADWKPPLRTTRDWH